MQAETLLKSLGWAALLAVANPVQAASPLTASAIQTGASFSTLLAGSRSGPDTFVAADASDPLAPEAGLPASAGFGNMLLGATYDALSRSYLYSGLAAGASYLRAAGSAEGASLAPTPQGCAMLLAGLGIVGTVIRRRSRSF